MKKIIIALVVVVLAGIGVYVLTKSSTDTVARPDVTESPTPTATASVTATPTPQAKAEQVIGKSVEGRDIIAYNFGTGDKDLLFIGGIHGGYEWNTVLAAYELMDYLKANPNSIPKNVRVTVIPVMNPDGLNKVVGTAGRFAKTDVPAAEATVVSGRFNANGVDLNRNFDCDWKANGVWQNKTVKGGSEVFSEPESRAVKAYVEQNKPEAAIVWYSAAGGVYSSNCHTGVLPETSKITDLYADASGYPAHENFDFYEITGDMVNWFAKNSIPAISVLLTNHTDTEWTKNKAGIEALLNYYATKQ